MADRTQLRVADHNDIAADDPFAELTRIMGFDPRQPVKPQASAQPPAATDHRADESDFDIDLEKELMGEFGAGESEAASVVRLHEPTFETAASDPVDDELAMALDKDFRLYAADVAHHGADQAAYGAVQTPDPTVEAAFDDDFDNAVASSLEDVSPFEDDQPMEDELAASFDQSFHLDSRMVGQAEHGAQAAPLLDQAFDHEFDNAVASSLEDELMVGDSLSTQDHQSAPEAEFRSLAQADSHELQAISDEIAKAGGTPLAVEKDGRLLGVIQLKDIVKGGIRERFAELRRMGIRTVMITGDNPMTAAAIAAEAGVDDFLAQATPEDKLKLIRDEQAKGKLVAMCGDGTNDAPALAQADVGVAMNTGTQAAREAGNMVDLDSNPTKLIEVVEIGKQLLMTRGALTTFSIANDVAKYFAIIPAMFLAFYPQLNVLNIMNLSSPQSAILSAIIFNALIIIALIPLALKGVRYRAIGAGALLRRNLLIYGLGGIIIPFIGIKAIDLIVAALHLA